MIKNKSLQMGLLYSLVGISIGSFVSFSKAGGGGYKFLPLYAGLSAFLTSSTLWWLIVERKNDFRPFKGIMAGFLSGIVSHPVCWTMYFIVANARYIFVDTPFWSLGETPQNPTGGVLSPSVISFILFGWLTVSTGIIIGGSLCLYSMGKATRPRYKVFWLFIIGGVLLWLVWNIWELVSSFY